MLTTLSYSYSHFPPRQTEVSMTRKIQNIFQVRQATIELEPISK